MNFGIRMKTGFFATARYNLSASSEGIMLSPVEEGDNTRIQVTEEDLKLILLVKEKNSVIEIKTNSQVLSGVFDNDLDLRDVHSELRKYIKKDLIYLEM